jgi:Skp family chaperone for outer membrane proteins
MKLKKILSRPALAAACFAAGLALASTVAQGQQHPAPAPQGAPMPKILVIDRQALLRSSNVGQDIARQVQGYTKAAESQLKGEGEGLRREEQSLQQQVAILAPDVKAQKIRAFEEKQQAFQRRVQQKQNQIRYGVVLAQRQVESVAGPIVQGLMQERGANLLLDRQAVVIGSPGLDVTKVAIDRLNQKLPSVKVQLVDPPAGMLQQQPAQ